MKQEEPIPTAEEFIEDELRCYEKSHIKDALIAFAKLHVEAALKAVSESESNGTEGYKIYKDSIPNAYPLTNIK